MTKATETTAGMAAVDMKRLVRESRDWPNPKTIALEYGLPERYVRNVIERGYVETVRMDCVRINPVSWEAFIASRHSAGQY